MDSGVAKACYQRVAATTAEDGGAEVGGGNEPFAASPHVMDYYY
jgi:hypothetical protein